MKIIAPARVALIAIVGAVALVGCSAINPIITQKDYAASDGLQADIGEVHAQNLLIVTAGEGEPASLTGSLYNRSDADEEIIFGLDPESPVTVAVPARTQVKLSIDGDATVVGIAPVQPGLIADLAIQSSTTGVITTPVPVVDGTLTEHQAELEALANQ